MGEDVAKEVTEMMKILLSKEMAEIMAKFLWEYFNQLKSAGFSQEQAMALCRVPDFKR